MSTANHAIQGSWNCQLYLATRPGNERACRALAMKWIEIVHESGGMLNSHKDGASLAMWDSPKALKAVLAMKAAAEKMNAALIRAARIPVPYALVLDGPYTPGQSSEAPLARRILKTRLASAAVWVATYGHGLAVTPRAAEILKPELPTEHLVATPCPMEGLSLLFCSRAGSGEFKPAPRPCGPIPGKAPVPVEVDNTISWIMAPGTDERTREFQLVRRKPAGIVPAAETMSV